MEQTAETPAERSPSDDRAPQRSPRLPPGSSVARVLVPVLGVLGVMVGLHAYIGARLLHGSGLPAWAEGAGWVLLGLLFVSIPLSFWMRSVAPASLAKPVQAIAYGWLGSLGVLASAVLATDLIRALYGLVTATPLPHQTVAKIQALGILVLVVPAVLWAFASARGKAQVSRVRVPLVNLGAGMEGVRIAQISDLHVGEGALDRRFLQRVVDQVNALKPDIIVITGDLVEGSVATTRGELEPLTELEAPLGVYFVTGNHEYYWGGPLWEAEVARLGVTVLHNAHKVVHRNGSALVVGGVTDFNGGHFGEEHASRPDVAFAEAPAGVPRVLLAHQPRSAEAASRAGVDLQLSGHTHGGQIFPFNFFVKLQQPVVRGLKKLHGLWIYTHRGTGYWGPPMRLFASPEIADITLVRGPG